MPLFLSLYLGHVLGDFVFQPGSLVKAKRTGPVGVLVHTAIVTACTAIVGFGILGETWPVVLAAGAAHFAVEHLTIGVRRTRQTSGLTVFLLDQGVHIVSLALLAMLSGVNVPPLLVVWEVDGRTLAIIAAVATASFLGSILVFETDQVRMPLGGPDPILALDGARLYGMAERGAGMAAALLAPTPLLGALAFAPRLLRATMSHGETRVRNLSAAGVGVVLCAVVWAIVGIAGY